MRAHSALHAALLCACIPVVACGAGPQVGRVGPPISLPQGEPQSTCEREGWYEVAPTRVRTTTVRGGGYVQTHYSQMWEGVGVYRLGEENPEDLEDVLPAMKEPRLGRDHNQRIEPVDAANREALYWLFGGVAGLFIGVGTAAAIQDESPTGAAVAGLSGLAIGIGGLVAGLIAMPSPEDELAADARRQLFLSGEDDLRAVGRGVDRANADQRRRCGGEPVAFAPPEPARAEPAAAPAAPTPAPVAPIHLERRQKDETPPDTPPPEPAPEPEQNPPSKAFEDSAL